MDDIIAIGYDPSLIQDTIVRLKLAFALKDLGYLNLFLGMEVTRKHNSFHLCQQKYIQEWLEKVQLSEAWHVLTRMSSSKTLSLQDNNLLNDPTQYRSVVEALQYCTITMLE